MKGRQPGRPVKWVTATSTDLVAVGKPDIKFEVWSKWKKNGSKLGTLSVNVAGVKWWPGHGKKARSMSWDRVAKLFE